MTAQRLRKEDTEVDINTIEAAMDSDVEESTKTAKSNDVIEEVIESEGDSVQKTLDAHSPRDGTVQDTEGRKDDQGIEVIRKPIDWARHSFDRHSMEESNRSFASQHGRKRRKQKRHDKRDEKELEPNSFRRNLRVKT